MAVKKCFVSEVYFDKLDTDKKKLDKQIVKLRSEALAYSQLDSTGIEWSEEHYINGYTSYSSIPRVDLVSETFKKLRKNIDAHVKKYASSLEWDIDYKKQSLEINSMWLNVMQANCHHGLHIHPHSVISGTIYFDTLPVGVGGELKLEDPRLSRMMASPVIKESANSMRHRHLYFKPKKGYLILFESWMRHEVELYIGKKERVSISFNYSLNDK